MPNSDFYCPFCIELNGKTCKNGVFMKSHGGEPMKKKQLPEGGAVSQKSGRLAMPGATYMGTSHMELNGNREVIVDGCGGVLEYDSDVVKIKTGKQIVKFTGRGLNIKCLTADSLIVEGFLTCIEFIT
jgi:sporulation protein YqfC